MTVSPYYISTDISITSGTSRQQRPASNVMEDAGLPPVKMEAGEVEFILPEVSVIVTFGDISSSLLQVFILLICCVIICDISGLFALEYDPVSILCVRGGLCFPLSILYTRQHVGTVSAPEEGFQRDPLEWTCSEVNCKSEDVAGSAPPLCTEFMGFTANDLNK